MRESSHSSSHTSRTVQTQNRPPRDENPSRPTLITISTKSTNLFVSLTANDPIQKHKAPAAPLDRVVSDPNPQLDGFTNRLDGFIIRNYFEISSKTNPFSLHNHQNHTTHDLRTPRNVQ